MQVIFDLKIATTGNTLAGQKCEIDALTEKIKQATLNGRYGTPEKSADKSSDSGKGSPETSSRESSGHEKLTLEQLAKEMLEIYSNIRYVQLIQKIVHFYHEDL